MTLVENRLNAELLKTLSWKIPIRNTSDKKHVLPCRRYLESTSNAKLMAMEIGRRAY